MKKKKQVATDRNNIFSVPRNRLRFCFQFSKTIKDFCDLLTWSTLNTVILACRKSMRNEKSFLSDKINVPQKKKNNIPNEENESSSEWVKRNDS